MRRIDPPGQTIDDERNARVRSLLAALELAGLPRACVTYRDGLAEEATIPARVLVAVLDVVRAARELRAPPATHEKIAALDGALGELAGLR